MASTPARAKVRAVKSPTGPAPTTNTSIRSSRIVVPFRESLGGYREAPGKVRENFAFELDKSAGESDKESVQFELRFLRRERAPVPAPGPAVELADGPVPVRLVRNPRARRYILRLTPDRAARVTIPRGGSAEEALRFVGRQKSWLEKQLQRLAARPVGPMPWVHGTEILFRGEPVQLLMVRSETRSVVQLGTSEVPVPAEVADVRPYVQRELWRLAIPELTRRTFDLATAKGFVVKRVSVRNQRSRWGSCSRRGTISLNWRLVQVPEFVRDYIILHELAHLREMNHSRRFWQVVEELCPDFRRAEDFLRKHAGLLR